MAHSVNCLPPGTGLTGCSQPKDVSELQTGMDNPFQTSYGVNYSPASPAQSSAAHTDWSTQDASPGTGVTWPADELTSAQNAAAVPKTGNVYGSETNLDVEPASLGSPGVHLHMPLRDDAMPRPEREDSAIPLSPRSNLTHKVCVAGELSERLEGISTTPSGLTTQPSLLDGSLVLGMERTLFSSLQVWIVIFMFGQGLMMTGATHDDVPDLCGLGFIVTAVIGLLLSWLVHVWRLRLFNAGHDIGVNGSAVWTAVIVGVLVCICGVELFFAVLYPYIHRSTKVRTSS